MLALVVLCCLVHIASAAQAPCIELSDGNFMPVVALGTGRGTAKESDSIDEVRDAVFWAIEAGYRHIDTAAVYGDEQQVGQGIADAIAKGLVTRDQIFVTTKLLNEKHARDQVVPSLKESLGRLGLEYVDLFLIHFPISTKSDGSPDDIDYVETWRGMEEAKDLGLARSIGVSNFNITQITRVVENSRIRPVVNEIEVNPTNTQLPLVNHCQNLAIAVMAYSPFGFLVSRSTEDAPPPRYDDPTLVAIANKYGKSTVQVVLRYLIERGLTPIPKSVNKKRIAQNIDLFDFQLTPEEVNTINSFNRNIRCKVTAADPGKAPTIKLNDGRDIPTLALGTYGSKAETARMRQIILWAIEAGYRHIDTASLHQNEAEIGQGIADGIKKGIVKREDMFVTTKLWSTSHGRHQVVPALRESLAKLNMTYVDLYLIHYPTALKVDFTPEYIDYLETWQGMEEAQRLGLAKSIGVSNFNTEQIDRIIANSTVTPAVNEIEVHPALTNEQLVASCQARGVTVMAYSPFGFLVSRNTTHAPPPRMNDPTLVAIAKKYGKTVGQVVMRYLVDRGLIPIPKSTNRHRLAENINVFDFKLTNDEIKTINKFNSNRRILDPSLWKNYPYFPFSKN